MDYDIKTDMQRLGFIYGLIQMTTFTQVSDSGPLVCIAYDNDSEISEHVDGVSWSQ